MNDQLEFLISQHLDGTLPPEGRAALEERLANDPAARELLEEYRRLDQVIKAAPVAVPAVNWDALSERISAAIDDEASVPASYPMPWVRRVAMPMSIAAAVLLTIGAAITIYLTQTPLTPASPTQIASIEAPQATPVIQITGPRPQAAPGQAVAVVAIGPTSAADEDRRIAEAIITRPSSVIWLASGQEPSQDGRLLPY